MPGIHVRSLGNLDWVERENEPVLTIPGSYWLCHKKHIYKFTFKWHKTLRNTAKLAYPKELTKVIRRIIKSLPRQGQQFGTRHLLVTYNQSPWMRQDKMFAMLKFRERTDATAFQHAFILTVQTLNDSSTENVGESNPDKDCVNDNSKETRSTRVRSAEEAKKGATNDDAPNHKTTNRRRSYLTTEEKNEKYSKIIPSEKYVAKQTRSSMRDTEMEREKDQGQTGTSRSRSHDKSEYSSRTKRRNRREYGDPENNKNKVPPDSPAEKGIAADFADLPYQYIIEKEIEASKSSPKKNLIATIERDSSPESSYKESDLPEKSLPRSPRAAQIETARSADITDLVMEGLMFTIRQDQDSVTVVEQKTKLEMDEVLENSEKAETKEGEKCLLNSSLLRLESLITKIEMSEARQNGDISRSPRETTNERNRKRKFPYDFSSSLMSNDDTICSEKYDSDAGQDESPGHIDRYSLAANPIDQLPNRHMPKVPFVKINLNNVKDVLNDHLHFDDDAKTLKDPDSRDEAMEIDGDTMAVGRDVVTENYEMEDEEEDEVGLELKYEEKDDSDRCKSETEEIDVTPETLQTCPSPQILRTVDPPNLNPSTPTKNNFELAKIKTPRVVSNEMLTDDQIPPELQRALRHKRFKRMHFDDEIENIARDTAESPSEQELPLIEPAEQELPLMEPSEQELPLIEPSEQELPLIEPSEQELPLIEPAEQELPLIEPSEQELPLIEPSEQELPLIEPSEQELPLIEPSEQELPLIESSEQELPLIEPSEQELPLIEPSEQELPLIEPSEQELPLIEPSEQELPLIEPSEQELPLIEPSEQELPLIEPSEQELPLIEPSEQELPLIEPSEQELPLIEPAETDLPLIEQVSSGDETIEQSEQSEIIDLTEEFERKLRNEKMRKQPVRRKSLRHTERVAINTNQDFVEKSEIRLDMWKFMQDITRGAKVVVHRLDLTNISNGVASASSFSKFNMNQSCATESK